MSETYVVRNPRILGGEPADLVLRDGVIAEVTLRLMPRVPVQRSVEILTLDELVRVPEKPVREKQSRKKS